MILLTRPYEDSLELAKILGEENCVIEPMLEIEKLNYSFNDGYQTIVTTSKNSPQQGDIKIPDYGKNAKEILDYCLKNLKPDDGKIIYLSGDVVTLDIAEELKKNGFDAERIISYSSTPVSDLSDNLLGNINKITHALFFSLRTIENFLTLIEKHSLQNELAHIACIAISDKVANAAKPYKWHKIAIADEPNLNSMLNLLDHE